MHPTTKITDAHLISEFLNGKQNAFQALLHRHQDRVYTAIFMLVRDHYIAEDIFQDTFLKIVQALRKTGYREQDKFLPWALRIARNLCMDHFRKTKPQPEITLSDGKNLFDWFRFSDTSADDRMLREELKQSIHGLISKLPEEQKEVLVLRIFGELSFKEIAGITSVSINTALGRMRYALINLRRMIAEHALELQ